MEILFLPGHIEMRPKHYVPTPSSGTYLYKPVYRKSPFIQMDSRISCWK